MITAYVQCRYLRKSGEQCTAEAVDDSSDAPILICSKHAAKVMQMISDARRRARV